MKGLVFFAPGLAVNDLKVLHNALRELASVKLSHVIIMDATQLNGVAAERCMVNLVESDLYVGYLSWSGRTVTRAWDIAFDSWLAVCGKVRVALMPLNFRKAEMQ